MKTISLGFGILASFGFAMSSQAEDLKCHVLKFDSYFVAQNVKDNIKRINPDLSHPNFNEKFLLLRAELAMETLYLIASCETGEFYHEKLSGNRADFSLAGPQVDLSDKTESTHYEWNGKSWLKGESKEVTTSPIPTQTPSTAVANSVPGGSGTSNTPNKNPSPTLLSNYDALFAKYPAQQILTVCAPIDYNSNFRAQQNKEVIQKLTPDLAHPNFAGSKILLRTEAIFETVTLIADCKTGKVSDELLKDHVSFQKDSRLVVVNSSDTHPELKVWSDAQWIQIPDPVQNKKLTISNTLYGEKAHTLVHVLPNPQHRDILRFENLKVQEETKSLFDDLGVSSILSGKCRLPSAKAPVCEVETQ